MAEREMTRDTLASLSGLSVHTLTALRSGKSCSKQTAEKLVSIFGDDIVIRPGD